MALLLDEPVRSEVEGLRRAVGDPSLGRMDPHLTLVPPVNVHPRDLAAAVTRVRLAASRQAGPLVATLGPLATFLPDNPVLYLGVGGDLPALRRLRDDVFAPPLARSLTWPWVPHVTLGDGIPPDRIEAAVSALDGYAGMAPFDRIVLLEEGRGRKWVPVVDACLEPPTVVGTGGIALTLTRGRIVGPDVRAAMADAGLDHQLAQKITADDVAPGPLFFPPIVLTASTSEGLAGAACAWADTSGAHAGVFVAVDWRRRGVGSHLLAHLESAARRAGWEFPVVSSEGPAGFYEARGVWARPGGRGADQSNSTAE